MKKIFLCLFVLTLSFRSISDSAASNGLVANQSVEFIFSKAMPVQDEIDIKVSPNPANDYFNVTSNINFNRIQLFNIIGKPLKTYRPSVDNNYQLNDIPGGIYILRFMDGNNQVIKTVKLYKKN